MTLKPIQKPHPPIWVAANGDVAIKRAARSGYTWYVNPHATYGTIARQVALYHETAGEAGVQVPDELPIGREIYVNEDRDRGIRGSQALPGRQVRGLLPVGPGEGTAGGGVLPSRPLRSLPGTDSSSARPRNCIRELEKYRALGMASGIFRMMWPGMELKRGIRVMELFAEKVMPHFK